MALSLNLPGETEKNQGNSVRRADEPPDG